MTENIPIKHSVHAVTASAILQDGIVLRFLSDPNLSSEGDLIELKYPDGSLSRLLVMEVRSDGIKVKCSDLKFDLRRDAQHSYRLGMSPTDAENVRNANQRSRYQLKSERPENTLMTRFDEADIRHGLQFVITGSGDIHPGTDIAVALPDGETRKLTIVLEKDASLWLALWHDETKQSPHDGQLFRIILVPPIEYEDDVPVERNFMVELVGDHELASP